jgi:hypothetical protein
MWAYCYSTDGVEVLNIGLLCFMKFKKVLQIFTAITLPLVKEAL